MAVNVSNVVTNEKIYTKSSVIIVMKITVTCVLKFVQLVVLHFVKIIVKNVHGVMNGFVLNMQMIPMGVIHVKRIL